MQNRKLVKVLIGTWAIATILLFIGLIVQMALPTLFKKWKYIEMLLDINQSMILTLLTLFIVSILAIVFVDKPSKMNKFSHRISKSKPAMMLITVLSMVICLLLVFGNYSTIASSVIQSNSVQTIKGKVEKVQSVSLSSSGKVVKYATVVDSDGKHYKLVPDRNLSPMAMNKNDKAVIDYIPTKNAIPKEADGKVLGYAAQYYDTSNENIKGILEDVIPESKLDKN